MNTSPFQLSLCVLPSNSKIVVKRAKQQQTVFEQEKGMPGISIT